MCNAPRAHSRLCARAREGGLLSDTQLYRDIFQLFHDFNCHPDEDPIFLPYLLLAPSSSKRRHRRRRSRRRSALKWRYRKKESSRTRLSPEQTIELPPAFWHPFPVPVYSQLRSWSTLPTPTLAK